MFNYVDNDGDRFETAIIILAHDNFKGIKLEYQYISDRFGKRGLNWQLESQSLLNNNGKMYDKMAILLDNGNKVTLYFDITNFFGNL